MTTQAQNQDLTEDQVQELIAGNSYIIIGRGNTSDDCQIENEEVKAWYDEYTDALSHRFTLEELINEVRPGGCDANDEEGSSIYILSANDLSEIRNVLRTKLKEFYVEESDNFGVEHYKEAIQQKIEEGESEEEAVVDVMNEKFNKYAGKLWYFGLEMPNNGLDSVMPACVEEFIEAMEDLGLSHLGSPGYAEGEGEGRNWKLY